MENDAGLLQKAHGDASLLVRVDDDFETFDRAHE
jgi:hypothetical protein